MVNKLKKVLANKVLLYVKCINIKKINPIISAKLNFLYYIKGNFSKLLVKDANISKTGGPLLLHYESKL